MRFSGKIDAREDENLAISRFLDPGEGQNRPNVPRNCQTRVRAPGGRPGTYSPGLASPTPLDLGDLHGLSSPRGGYPTVSCTEPVHPLAIPGGLYYPARDFGGVPVSTRYTKPKGHAEAQQTSLIQL